MEWISLLRDIGVFGLAVWCIQRIIINSANRKFELFKAEIEKDNKKYQSKLDASLESHKTQLNILTLKNIKLHELRLGILAELYEKISVLNMDMKELTVIIKEERGNYEKEEKGRIENAVYSYNDFSKYYEKKKIFFLPTTAELIDELKNHYFDSLRDYTYTKKIKLSDEFNYELLKKSWNKIKDEVPKILVKLESDFRELLGVIDISTNNSSIKNP